MEKMYVKRYAKFIADESDQPGMTKTARITYLYCQLDDTARQPTMLAHAVMKN